MGFIETPEHWETKMGEQITVGEVMGILGKMLSKTTG
jgi:hypothetical protein